LAGSLQLFFYARMTRAMARQFFHLSLPAAKRLRQRLLVWFRGHKRDLPWRRTRDAYRIWLSEVMLQQTRVAAVVPYYERFLKRFPNLRRLARARREEVLKLWAGLGYYRRARDLHAAARRMATRHRAQFPGTLPEALALPGIGRCTAAAVLSMAYGSLLAVLDGNAARVLARLGAMRGDLRAPSRWRRLELAAERLLAPRAPGEWNQAMMELGATICTPRAPRCQQCPVARWCRAYALGIADQLPTKRRKPAAVSVHIAAAVLRDPRGRTLLLPKPRTAQRNFFSGLWQFPAVETEGDAGAAVRELLRRQFGIVAELVPLAAVRHTVTHHRITLWPFLVPVKALPAGTGVAVRLDRLDGLAVSSATRKLAARALLSQQTPQ